MAFFFGNGNSFQDFLAHIPFMDPRNHPAFYNEETALRAAMDASMQDQQQQQQQPKGPPPASQRALKSLPRIRISTEDLVDPVNRECCICLEAHPLHTHALRLPCAHIFHPECIQSWLQSSCTCPVCRYELPTDDAAYEAGRIQRMKERKPRFARHELDRLPLKRLKELRLSSSYHAVDRQDLIEYLIKSGSIETIATPEPVEYSLKALRAMSVAQLRRCMNEEAGVFFDPKDVVEKEDMIRIFLMSGRLMVTPEEDGEDNDDNAQLEQEDTKPAAPLTSQPEQDVKSSATPRGPIVETVTNEEILEVDERTNRDIVMEETECDDDQSLEFKETVTPSNQPTTGSNPAAAHSTGQQPHIDSADDTNMYADVTMSNTPTDVSNQNEQEAIDRHIGDDVEADEPVTSSFTYSLNHTGHDSENHSADGTVGISQTVEEAQDALGSVTMHSVDPPESTDMESEAASFQTNPGDESVQNFPSPDNDSRRGRKRPLLTPPAHTSLEDGDVVQTRFDTLSISELRSMGRSMSIKLSDCIERQEMVRRLSSGMSDAQASTQSASESDGESVEASLLEDWSVSEIRTVARLVNVDLFNATTRQDMVSALCQGTTERPHAGRFLRALVPFIGLSISQLKAAAREMRISLSGCIEKDDMLSRIVESQTAQA